MNSGTGFIPIRDQDDGVTDDCGVSVDSHPEVVGAVAKKTRGRRLLTLRSLPFSFKAPVCQRLPLLRLRPVLVMLPKYATTGDSRPRVIRIKILYHLYGDTTKTYQATSSPYSGTCPWRDLYEIIPIR
jgi:hypothetical protein